MPVKKLRKFLFFNFKLNKLILILFFLGLSHVQIVQAATSVKQVNIFQESRGIFPSGCDGVISGISGLCVVASTSPRPTNSFLVRKKGQGFSVDGSPIKVILNNFLRLDPGEYFVYSESGLDAQHEYKISIAKGGLAVVTTGSVKFKSSGKSVRIQHYQDANYGGGCRSLVLSNDVLALLPGNYQATVLNNKSPPEMNCTNSGVTFNLLERESLSSSIINVRESSLPKYNKYHHPNGVSSLANISQFRADINALGLLPKWRSFKGINNPHRTTYKALILEGIANHKFLVPFRLVGKISDCGQSLAKAGLPAKTLLSNCVFQGKKLTRFTVQQGNYYIFNNRHGKTAIEANFINNQIPVNGVRFVTE